jgi:hypothetical protein
MNPAAKEYRTSHLDMHGRVQISVQLLFQTPSPVVLGQSSTQTLTTLPANTTRFAHWHTN